MWFLGFKIFFDSDNSVFTYVDGLSTNTELNEWMQVQVATMKSNTRVAAFKATNNGAGAAYLSASTSNGLFFQTENVKCTRTEETGV